MKIIDNFSDNPNQIVSLILDDGSKVRLSISYWQNQSGWFYSISHGDFSVNNRRLVNSPNMLRQFRNIIPFGIAVIASDGGEPVFLDDFSSGRIRFLLLNASDVAEIESELISV